jgi:DNA-directed RNA polymerase specialized sigma24 family protein
MMPLNLEEAAPYILSQASCRARFVVSRSRLPQDTWEDLSQEFALDCLQRVPHFNPARGDGRAFIRGVIRNRSAIAAHRELKRAQSEAPVRSDVGPCCADRTPREPASADPTSRLAFSVDLQRYLATLPVNLQRLAHDLTYLPPQIIARKWKRSPQRIYQLIGKLRAALLRSGLLPDAYRLGGVR